MNADNTLVLAWDILPEGARSAFQEQWAGLAAGGLPCGSAIVDARGNVVASGRNHAYDRVGEIETRIQYPLQHNRLAHAELNAMARVPTEADHATLTLWTTQHPCSMCAAAIAFVGIGQVHFIADDPSDSSPAERIVTSRTEVEYQALDDPLWWTVSNLLFLYNSAVLEGGRARNIARNREIRRELVALTLELAKDDVLGRDARSGTTLTMALTPLESDIRRVAKEAS